MASSPRRRRHCARPRRPRSRRERPHLRRFAVNGESPGNARSDLEEGGAMCVSPQRRPFGCSPLALNDRRESRSPVEPPRSPNFNIARDHALRSRRADSWDDCSRRRIQDPRFRARRPADYGERGVRDEAEVRRHLCVGDAIHNYRIPSTFDGEVPEFAFGEAERRWKIGERYELPDAEPQAIPGSADDRDGFDSGEGRVLGIPAGRRSEHHHDRAHERCRELAYNAHPDTFFGDR